MDKVRVGIAGDLGSFSEEAAMEYAKGNNIINPSISYLIGTEEVLEAINKGSVDVGIFPIENSNGGLVIESIYAMAAHAFHIEQLFEMDVNHMLLVTPGATAADISSIVSHSQALKQCRMYLKRKWKNTELREYADTALAAKDLGKGTLKKNVAVIAPKKCAGLYKLDILEESIQDLKFNFTAFIAATK